MHQRWLALTAKSPLRAPSVPQVAVMTDAERDSLDLVNTNIQTYWKEMRDKFITGEASIDAEWDRYVSSLKALGLDTFVEVYQSIYDRTR